LINFLLFKTDSGNSYLYSPKQKKFLLLHPTTYYLLDLYKKNYDLKKFIAGLKKGINIPDYGKCTKKEILYHLNKIEFFKKNKFFESFDSAKFLSFKLKAEDIKKALANTDSCTLEVTEKCNLNCLYCAYGNFYQNYEQRNKKNMDFSFAKKFLDYLLNLWNSPLNKSHNKHISVGFYGGEPLLNFSLIESLVKYLVNQQNLHNEVTFHMTTNGILLNRYIDFLVKYDFKVLISLDGDKDNNSYRRFSDGNLSYFEVLNNIKKIMGKYPKYFKNRINFNAVLHNRNSRHQIYKYFKDNFKKTPNISSIAPIGIKESEKSNFQKLFNSGDESSEEKNYLDSIESEALLGKYENLTNLLHSHCGYIYRKYQDLSDSGHEKMTIRIPSGTCIPFSRKIFLTAKGKILPCERVSCFP